MNPPSRPRINPAPKLADFSEHAATTIIRAIEQMYECAFRADPAQHTHLMEQAHTAPQVLTDAIHELLYRRREIQLEAARAESAEVANPHSAIHTPHSGAEPAESQPPFTAAAAEQVAAQASIPRSRDPSIPGSPRPPTRDELVADIGLLHRLLADAEQRLDDIALIVRLAGGTCQQLTRLELLGVVGLLNAVVHRQDAKTPNRTPSVSDGPGNQATRQPG